MFRQTLKDLNLFLLDNLYFFSLQHKAYSLLSIQIATIPYRRIKILAFTHSKKYQAKPNDFKHKKEQEDKLRGFVFRMIITLWETQGY